MKIKDLHVKVENKTILNDLSLDVDKNKVSVLMGPNGSGKSTLAQVLMGNPFYEVTGGSVEFEGRDILNFDPARRSLAGLFLSFQYPSEVTGVTVASFLRLVYNKHTGEKLSPVRFRELLKEKMELLDMKDGLEARYLNEGFSGGEKKKLEMLQMLILEPVLAILDEVDSGLDIDALKFVADAVNYLKDKETTFLIITHYTRILNHIEPDKVYVMKEGRIVRSGGKKLAHDLEKQGYAPFGK